MFLIENDTASKTPVNIDNTLDVIPNNWPSSDVIELNQTFLQSLDTDLLRKATEILAVTPRSLHAYIKLCGWAEFNSSRGVLDMCNEKIGQRLNRFGHNKIIQRRQVVYITNRARDLGLVTKEQSDLFSPNEHRLTDLGKALYFIIDCSKNAQKIGKNKKCTPEKQKVHTRSYIHKDINNHNGNGKLIAVDKSDPPPPTKPKLILSEKDANEKPKEIEVEQQVNKHYRGAIGEKIILTLKRLPVSLATKINFLEQMHDYEQNNKRTGNTVVNHAGFLVNKYKQHLQAKENIEERIQTQNKIKPKISPVNFSISEKVTDIMVSRGLYLNDLEERKKIQLEVLKSFGGVTLN